MASGQEQEGGITSVFRRRRSPTGSTTAARAHSLENLEEYDVIETPKKEAKSTGGANGFSFILHEQVATRQFSTGIVSLAGPLSRPTSR